MLHNAKYVIIMYNIFTYLAYNIINLLATLK